MKFANPSFILPENRFGQRIDFIINFGISEELIDLKTTSAPINTRVRTTEASFAECVYLFFSVMFYLLSLY